MLLEDLLTGGAAERTASRPVKDTRDLEGILKVIRKINASLGLFDVLALVLDEAIRITSAERGFLMLANGEGSLEFVAGRTAHGEVIPADTFRVSATALHDVFTTGESLCIESALQDARFEQKESVMDLGLQTILCSPLRTLDETIGVIYVDSRSIQPIHRNEILNVFEILAGQAAIAIKNARLYGDLQMSYRDLSDANDQIVRLERLATKGEMVAEISHELKNMVNVLGMSLSMLESRLEKIPQADVGKYLSIAKTTAERIAGFTESLQSRGTSKANMVRRDPNRVVQEFADFVRVLPRFKKGNLVLQPAQGVPEALLDRDQIHQVLLNLCMNALDARPDATITLSSAFDLNKDMVAITVSDNGPGIEESVIGKLFKEKITTKTDGHGYGLQICRQVVEHHGGAISVRSRVNEGTVFTIYLPPATLEQSNRTHGAAR